MLISIYFIHTYIHTYIHVSIYCYIYFVINYEHLGHSCKVKIKFTLQQVTKAQRGSRGIALLFL